ncbi:hypothetical protein ACEN2B_00505 [Corynebacterium auriscanis]|uniref:hypothetical protein n=1 Tax=Corynebacterium auriscanis TaxID=99807 RepID=UPI003CED5A54
MTATTLVALSATALSVGTALVVLLATALVVLSATALSVGTALVVLLATALVVLSATALSAGTALVVLLATALSGAKQVGQHIDAQLGSGAYSCESRVRDHCGTRGSP